MYNLPYFKEKDTFVVLEFMKQHSFALLTGSNANNEPIATQVPLLIEEKEGNLTYYGHIQRKTDHHLAFEHNANALVVFTGPHAYISASWYPNPQSASTWNYISVHAKGKLIFLDDEKNLLHILSKTTAYYENNNQSPALVEKMEKEYVSKMMKAIIAFKIEVTHIDNVFKLSQNRDKKTYENIILQLEAQQNDGAKAIASQMKNRSLQLFNKQP